jgi:hypothetical protein
VVVVLVVTAGCQGLPGSSAPPSDQRAVDAVANAQDTSRNVTAYRVSIDGQVRIRDDSRSESIEITGEGLVNADRQQMNVTVGSRGDTGVGLRNTRMAYVDGYTLTTECSRLGWARYNLTDSTQWFNYTPLGQQLALLDRTNVYWNGTERVNGSETDVIIAHPTEDQLQANQNLPTGNIGTQGSATLDNATVRVWIDTETHQVRKVQREIHVRGNGATGVATITFRFTQYNEPTNITRPAFEDSGAEWSSGCPNA